MQQADHMRHHAGGAHLASPFGDSSFGQLAESFARLFGTPTFIGAQPVIVVLWLVANIVGPVHWDEYPFVFLNLTFSLQAAYAAPLILLAQTRQADRDKVTTEADAHHREELASMQLKMLQQNTEITQQVGERAGNDGAIMPHITSANVACGAHAGDAQTMRTTVALALDHRIAIGAHPGYRDPANFGRTALDISPDALLDDLARQLDDLRVV